MAIDSAILTYHSLDESGSPISVSPRKFAAQMQSLADSGIPVLPLPEVLRAPGSVAITFDDAFCSFYDSALPVLRRHKFPATVFVVTGMCGAFNDWNQLGYSVPRLPLMTWDQIRAAAGEGIEFGAHTHTHEVLRAGNAEREMRRSRDELEQRLGMAATLFAYPYGHSDKTVREYARAIFSYACGTELGYIGSSPDKICLPRIDSYYMPEPAALLMTPKIKLYMGVRRRLRQVRSWMVRSA